MKKARCGYPGNKVPEEKLGKGEGRGGWGGSRALAAAFAEEKWVRLHLFGPLSQPFILFAVSCLLLPMCKN